MTHIQNPILKGFNPDPSVCRVDDIFYVAVSTFEWYPGVQIWCSYDLQTWGLASRPLSKHSLLNMQGIQSSGGIWAPCLTHHEDMFYLVYTPVKHWRGEDKMDWGSFKDTPNYLTTCRDIRGKWSDPVYLNSSGFDASMFHDDDEKSYVVNMEWDYRGKPTFFSGILLQEYDKKQQKLIGKSCKIFTNTGLDRAEAPHIYKRKGWYYLMIAEGGTSYEHAVSLMRSRDIRGPYEIHPANPLLTSIYNRPQDVERIMKNDPPENFYHYPQKAGHGSMCQLTEEEWALFHLCGRPVQDTIICPLGRETSVQRLLWANDDWPYIVTKDNTRDNIARTEAAFSWSVSASHSTDNTAVCKPSGELYADFSTGNVHPRLRSLRCDMSPYMSLTDRAGWLRLHGAESPISTFKQSLLASAVTAFDYTAETLIDYHPLGFQQMAGLIVRYDERNQHYLCISAGNSIAEIQKDELPQRILQIVSIQEGRVHIYPVADISEERIILGLRVHNLEGHFYWKYMSSDKAQENAIDIALPMSSLSDEGTWPMGFTGTFVGIACHDMSGSRRHADFRWFRYME